MPWQAAWGMTDAKGKFKVAFPPTAYYEMVNDPQTAAQIKQVGGCAKRDWGEAALPPLCKLLLMGVLEHT